MTEQLARDEWRPIPDFPGYEVNGVGQVRSWHRWRGRPGPRLLTEFENNRGYLAAPLVRSDGAKKRPMIHSLVAAAFIGPRPSDQEIRHLNGDRRDNRPENLAYGTHAENYADMFRHGTHPMASRSHCKRGHEFTAENTRMAVDRKGSTFRRCLTCQRICHAKQPPRPSRRRIDPAA